MGDLLIKGIDNFSYLFYENPFWRSFVMVAADVVTEFIEGLVETYPGLQYLDGFPEVICSSSLLMLIDAIRLYTHKIVTCSFAGEGCNTR